MNKTDKQKLLLLKYIFRTETAYTSEDLANYLTVSTKTAIRYFKELQEDCLAIFSRDQFFLDKQDWTIRLTMAPNLSPHFVIDRLHVMYTERSIEYRIIDSLLLKKYENVNQLADELFISPSTLYRILYKLEPFVQSFGMNFSFFDKESSLNFEYEEKNLRLFAYFFYWTSLKGIHQEPISFHKKVIINSDDKINWQGYEQLMPSKKEQIRYICSITALRNQQTKDSLVIPEDVCQLLDIFSSVNDLSSICMPLVSQAYNQTERLFVNLFFRLVISDMDAPQKQEEIGEHLLQLDNEISTRAQLLLASVSNSFQLSFSRSVYLHYYYYYILIILFSNYLAIALPEDFDEIEDLLAFSKYNPSYSDSLFNQATSFVDDYSQTHLITEAHRQNLIPFICLLINTKPKPPMLIAIQYSKVFMGQALIEQQLLLIFNRDSIQFTRNHGEANLIISDCFAPIPPKKAFFYLDTLTDMSRWDILFDYVRHLLSVHILPG